MSRPFYVTTPIYYINDVPHLGTAYSTIAADVLRRYHAVRGERTFFLTGTDEHGLKIERVAKERGLAPKAFADEMSAPFRETWPKLACAPDDFIRTTDERHERWAAELWKRVAASGDLYEGTYEGWYCVGCEAYYTEKELAEGNVCATHKTPAERVREPSYFFKLSRYQDRLLELYRDHPSFVAPGSRLNEVKSFVAGGLSDLSVSRTTFSWGVPVPGDPRHVMYVWFDALANYWTVLQDDPERAALWPASLHVVGKDILRFHAIYWPAFLMSAGLPLPEQVFAHGFLTFGGQKMSKSLRNTVKPTALADAFGVDTLRYYLMRAIAFGQDGDFDVHDLVARYNADLGNALGNLLQRVLPFCHRVFEGLVPPDDAPPEEHEALLSGVPESLRMAGEAFATPAPHVALERIWSALRDANAYVDRSAPWDAAKKGDKPRLAGIVVRVLRLLESVSVALWPVMPGKADELRLQLGLGPVSPSVGLDLWPSGATALVAGAKLGEVAALFPRIDPDRQAELIASLGLAPPAPAAVAVAAPSAPAAPAASAPAPGAPQAAAADQPPSIAYDDFAKVDLRVGVVVAAERVPRKDKLLSLRVDLGEAEPRAIVAGLALSFAPEALVGKRVLVVANLEPRTFGKGLVSHGMILASGPSESLTLATVSGEPAAGSRVK